MQEYNIYHGIANHGGGSVVVDSLSTVPPAVGGGSVFGS